MKSIILILYMNLAIISLGLSCTIESLKIIYPRTRSRIVPNNTLVMLKCLTSNCDHLYMTTPKEEDLFNCGNIEKNGTLMCNITITEPVEVICVGTDSKPVVCDSRSSILIEIEDSASDKCTCPNEIFPSTSCITKPTESPKSSDWEINKGCIITIGVIGAVTLIAICIIILLLICCCFWKHKYIKQKKQKEP